MAELNVDTSDILLGRLASFVAKQALLGHTVNVVNAENAYISGSREAILARYHRKVTMGNNVHGPFFHRSPEKIVRRTIRGMVPYSQPRGKLAFRRIMCYQGVPEVFANKKLQTLNDHKIEKLPTAQRMSLKTLSHLLGMQGM